MTLRRILIVDDAMDLGRMLQDAVRTVYPGLPVLFAPSAEEALLEASRSPVDLLVADIRLPGMSGIELARKIRARQPGVRVVMITGLKVDSYLRKQCEEVGAEALLAKPVQLADFLALVQSLGGEMTLPAPPPQEPRPRGRSGRTAPLRSPARPAPADAAALLSELRAGLGAPGVFWLDRSGRVLAQAGDWPPGLEAKLPALAAGALDALNGVAATLEGSAGWVTALRANAYDLALAPAGPGLLLACLKSGPSALRLALAFEETLAAARRLEALSQIPLAAAPAREAAPPPPPEPAPVAQAAPPAPVVQVEPPAAAPQEIKPPTAELPDLQALEAILGQPAAFDGGGLDPNSFWDDVADGKTAKPPSGPGLSFEEARKLGLVEEE